MNVRRFARALALLASLWAGAAAPAAGQEPGAPRGEPLVLAPSAQGGVWWGGAAAQASAGTAGIEDEFESVGYVTPAGALEWFPFPAGTGARFAQYFAPAPGGAEWFLAESAGGRDSVLGEATPLGTVTLARVALAAGQRMRGLAADAEGNLWSTESGRSGAHATSAGAVVRISPQGAVTRFAAGLLRGAQPESIVRGPQHAMWFLDAAGRVGRIGADGRIREFPLGRRIAPVERPFAPPRPIVASGGELWFLAGADRIGRMSAAGRVRIFNPRSSYRGVQALGENGNMQGLAAGPDGQVWFTRDSGEVARISRWGRVTTVTNRLVTAFGIAFDRSGHAWVGEGAAYERPGSNDFAWEVEEAAGEALPELEPARIARVGRHGEVAQYPPAPECRVPRLVGLEHQLVGLDAARDPLVVSSTEPSLDHCDLTVRLGRTAIRREGRSGRLFVVAQTPRPGTVVRGYAAVDVTLAVPAVPRGCRAPRPFRVLASSSRLVMWKVVSATEEGVQEEYAACVPPRGRRRVLARAEVGGISGGGSVTRVTSAGSFVAYEDDYGSKYGSSQELRLEDVRSGREARIGTDGQRSEYGADPGPEQLPQLEHLGAPVGRGVRSLALSARGALAWVGEAQTPQDSPRTEVLYVRDRRGRIRRLAAAHTIGAPSFEGSTLTWSAEGARQAAPITTTS